MQRWYAISHWLRARFFVFLAWVNCVSELLTAGLASYKWAVGRALADRIVGIANTTNRNPRMQLSFKRFMRNSFRYNPSAWDLCPRRHPRTEV
jgi:hypothetical protein